MAAKNKLVEKFEKWLDVVYQGRQPPPKQLEQLEHAFFAGAAWGGDVCRRHGERVVMEALHWHIDRQNAATTAAVISRAARKD